MDDGFDITSYVLGLQDGRKAIVIDSDSYIFTDDDLDGHIVVTEVE